MEVRIPPKTELLGILRNYVMKRNLDRRDPNLEKITEKLERLLKENKELKRKVSYDGLTGLLKREKFEEVLNKLMYRSNRLNAPLSYILIDIDKFKSINDTYGHNVGDRVLKEAAKTITKTVRDSDVLCRDFVGRHGGEEISVFLTNTDKAGAMIAGERIRKAVEERFRDKDFKVTISAGIATYSPKGDTKKDYSSDIENLTKKADEKLYKAKDRGRNKVVY